MANERRLWYTGLTVAALAAGLISCGAGAKETAGAAQAPEVGVVRAGRQNLERTLVVSSELVPFQQIDVYAKESGFVQKLNVDYGTHVKAGDVMAVLEIPELQMQLDEDEAAIKDAEGQAARNQDELNRVEAEQKVTHLQYSRLDQVAKTRPGLIAQQEIDDWEGKDLAVQAQVAAAQSNLQSAESQLVRYQAKRRHDQVFFDYSKITAPFSGVVTKRYANLGTLMQSGVSSSTQALPLVQLSEDDKFRLVIPVAESYVPEIRMGCRAFRLVIPVPESYVPEIRIGDGVRVRVASLNRSFPGRVARFSVDVEEDTRTMHTEVDVPNPEGVLMPGMYAEATLTLERREGVVALPPEAVITEGDKSTVWMVDGSGKAQPREVTLGVETPARIEVVSGLSAGDLVVEPIEVVSGLSAGDLVAVGDRSGLRAGERVRPKEVTLLQYQGEQ